MWEPERDSFYLTRTAISTHQFLSGFHNSQLSQLFRSHIDQSSHSSWDFVCNVASLCVLSFEKGNLKSQRLSCFSLVLYRRKFKELSCRQVFLWYKNTQGTQYHIRNCHTFDTCAGWSDDFNFFLHCCHFCSEKVFKWLKKTPWKNIPYSIPHDADRQVWFT